MHRYILGKIGDELQLDSFTLLLYNSLWSTPLSVGLHSLPGVRMVTWTILGVIS